jgi:hypothetical protein
MTLRSFDREAIEAEIDQVRSLVRRANPGPDTLIIDRHESLEGIAVVLSAGKSVTTCVRQLCKPVSVAYEPVSRRRGKVRSLRGPVRAITGNLLARSCNTTLGP